MGYTASKGAHQTETNRNVNGVMSNKLVVCGIKHEVGMNQMIYLCWQQSSVRLTAVIMTFLLSLAFWIKEKSMVPMKILMPSWWIFTTIKNTMLSWHTLLWISLKAMRNKIYCGASLKLELFSIYIFFGSVKQKFITKA